MKNMKTLMISWRNLDFLKEIKIKNLQMVITVKFQKIRHKTAVVKLQKDDELEEDAEIEIKNAITAIEIDLNTIIRKEDGKHGI